MSSQHRSGLPPSLIVSSHDLARLEALLDSPSLHQHPAALALGAELSRATVLAPDQIPADIVTMHARVDCEDELHGDRHQLTLVYPHEADAAQGRISVLAPVGSALLGLAVGQSIEWPGPGGRALRLRVIAVQAPGDAMPATR